jgi:lipopolysaccharide transport system ATP-binding protein
MSETVIKLENIGKQYRLGTVGSQTLRGDLQRWWYNMRGKEDPALKIGQTNQLNQKSKIKNQKSDYVWALRDINLEVKQGEILGIIGKNGAGKSTLLKLLSRVTGPTTGQIKVKGRIASLLEVGTGFHPELTGRENIFLNGAILGMTKNDIRLKFDEIVDFAGVAKYIDTPVKRYSSGMYVRLAFAVAAHLEPDILVVDEVLAVGDAEFQKKAIGKMQDVSKGGGRTVLFVSHNMALIQNICQNVLLLQNGKIKNVGNVNNIIRKYLMSEDADSKRKIESKLINSVKLKNIEGETTTNIKIGDGMVLDVVFIGMKHYPHASVGFIIKNKMEQWITTFTSDMVPIPYKELRTEKELVELTITDLPLNPDTYTIDISISQAGEGRIEYLTNVASFQIIDSDVYGTGFQLTPYFGSIHIKGQWRVENV